MADHAYGLCEQNFMALEALHHVENCCSSYSFLTMWHWFHLFMSLCPSFHNTVFFVASLALLHSIKFLFLHIPKFVALWCVCFVMLFHLLNHYAFVSLVLHLINYAIYIQLSGNSSIPTSFPTLVAHRTKTTWQKGDRSGIHFKRSSC